MFVDVGEGLPTNAEISKIWEIRSVLLFRDNAGVFPDPESRESKIVCIFFPRPIWSLGVPPFDPGSNVAFHLVRVRQTPHAPLRPRPRSPPP